MASGGGNGSAAGRLWVPMRVGVLSDILLELDTSVEQRWCKFRWECAWEKDAAATVGPDDDAARRKELLQMSSFSWYAFACMLRRVEDDLDEANDPYRRPQLDSAYWWRRFHGGPNRFVLLSLGLEARVRGLWADAYARTWRAAEFAEDIARRCQPGTAAAAAAENSMPRLVGRLRRLQRLLDDVLVRVLELKRIFDHLMDEIGTIVPDGRGAKDAARGGKRRGRSAPPPHRPVQGIFLCSAGSADI